MPSRYSGLLYAVSRWVGLQSDPSRLPDTAAEGKSYSNNAGADEEKPCLDKGQTMGDKPDKVEKTRSFRTPMMVIQALQRLPSRIQPLKRTSAEDLLPEIVVVTDVCHMRDSPYRIFKAAEAGHVDEVARLITAQPDRLSLRNVHGKTVLHEAAAKNQTAVVKYLVQAGADLNAQDGAGNTALHFAVENDAVDSIDVLVQSGAGTDILNDRHQAPIHLATELNKVPVLKMLVSHYKQVDILQRGDLGRTALHLAAIHDLADCAKILICELHALPKQACDSGYHVIHEAARHAASNTMEVLLEWSDSAGISRAEIMSFYDAEGNVPLHSAVHSGDIKAVEICLRAGARISTQQHDLSTPVHLAASQGALHLVRLMFRLQPEERATCLAVADAQKMTPLHCSAMFNHSDVVHFLLTEGADLEARDRENRTPLLLAASRGAWRTVHVLLSLKASTLVKDQSGRNVLHLIVLNGGGLEEFTQDLSEMISAQMSVLLDERDKAGCTPLHYACRYGNVRSLKGLLGLGASVSLKNYQHENPLHFAARYGRFQTVRQLLDSEKGQSIINESDGHGLTPLHIAAQQGHAKVVQLLLNRGALLHRDHLGRTSLHLCSMMGHTETLDLLLTVHAHLLNQQDKEGNTALHLATIENKPATISLLLSMNCALIANNKGLYAIDNAIHYKQYEAALALATHEERGDEILGNRSERTPCVIISLISTLPRVAEAVLNRSIIRATCKKESKLYYTQYSFRYLQMCPDRLDMYRKLHNDPNWKPEPLCAMNAMVEHGRVELLSHPLCQKFLEFKWHSYGMYFHVANLVFYLFFLASITVFSSDVMMTPLNSEFSQSTLEANKTARSVVPGRRDLGRLNRELYNAPLTYLCGISIIVFILISMVRESCHLVRQRARYFTDFSNVVSWVLYLSSTVMVSPVFCGTFSPVSYSAAAIATFLCWFNLLVYLQRFDRVGIYVVMFFEILKTLLRVLMVFSILIIAFGLAFYILLSDENHVSFQHIPMALVRTFTMMLGEMDFVGTFVRPLYGEHEGGSVPTLELPRTSLFILCVFMVLMPILLMNLLIGLAVGDIEAVRRNAQLKLLAMQVEMHTDLERRLPQFILKRVDRMELVEYPNTCTGAKKNSIICFLKYLLQTPFTDYGEDGDGPVETSSEDSLFEEMHIQKRKLEEIGKNLEAQSQLLRLIIQKMEIKTEADEVDEGVRSEDFSAMALANRWSSPRANRPVRRSSTLVSRHSSTY